MTPFVTPHRMLDPAFLDTLESLAAETKSNKGNWWRDILAHPELLLAVRRNSINAYYRGASIFRIGWKAGEVVTFTHAKYLVRPVQAYISLENGEFRLDTMDLLQRSYVGGETLDEMCKAASRYAGAEKAGLHPMLVGNPDVIDAEVALTRVSSPDDDDEEDGGSSDRKQDRIDAAIAALENGVPIIRFYEAKHFTNSALRASGRPDVIRQIEDYKNALETHRAQLSARYVETAKALLRLNDMRVQAFGASAGRKIAPAIIQIAKTGQPPAIDTLPHLIIYGFDKAQRDDPVWEMHFKKLKEALPGRKARVRAIGNPTRTTVFHR